ncbi:MAG: PP2C family protein-serine/threonine phosphatase, partial [Dolichospermum sp.]
IWYGVYNRITRELIYASGGHPPAIMISGTTPTNTDVKRLKTPGIPVGMFPEAKYVDSSCYIEKSSTLYIFSDGAYEITQANGTLWSLEGLIQIFISLHHSVENQLDYILDYLINLNS